MLIARRWLPAFFAGRTLPPLAPQAVADEAPARPVTAETAAGPGVCGSAA
jgi:hypothetical protein